jgi:hypothetical protein
VLLSLPYSLLATLYFSTYPYQNLEFIGAIANERPSDIFHTGWSLNPSTNTLGEVKLVAQVEPLANVETLVRLKHDADLNQVFAKKVAYNLFNFLQSFNRVRRTHIISLINYL